MKLKFLGATECITGSCHLLEANNKKILLDCGLFQGKDTAIYDNEKFEFNPEEIDYVILSHCHIDHSGRIPLLVKRGFKGKILCTEPTVDLCEYLLKDTAKIQGEEIYYKNLSRQKKGLEALNSIYEENHVEESLKYFYGCKYNEEIYLEDDIKIIFREAGHILGSAICEILIKTGGTMWNKIVYSGDIGNINKDILKDPQYGIEADYLILESTNGNKIHKREDNYPKLLDITRRTMARGGNVIIPCFSLGRTQEIIYMLNKFVESGKLKGCEVYVDSPLASAITNIFRKYEDYFDKESKALIARGDDPLEFSGLHFIEKGTEDDVFKIKAGAIIIAAGGIYDGGRVARHLKNNIDRRESSIIITAYQGRRSLGGKLLSGYQNVDIMGETIKVKASIYYMGGFSGHADKRGLMNWVENLKKTPERIFLVHGEGKNIESFNRELRQRKYNVHIAQFSKEFENKDN